MSLADPARIENSIELFASFSETPPPGITRVLFSEMDRRAKQAFSEEAVSLGLTVSRDAVGNLFARWPGQDPALSPVATGSHLDAIPHAGKYDCVVGIIGALEAIRSLRMAWYNPPRSIDVIVFAAEEPTRFGVGCLGSRLLAGALNPARARHLRDADGKTLAEWLEPEQEQALSSVGLARGVYHRFVELHIEQGPILERDRVDVGIVEKIAAPAGISVQLHGSGGHAGAVLMRDRRDALLGGAEIALAVDAVARTGGADTVATTGEFLIKPNAINSIPSVAELKIDLRDTDAERRDRLLRQLVSEIDGIAHRRGLRCNREILYQDAPAVCEPELVALAETSARQAGLTTQRMVSRAYHDSLFMSLICPTTMLFIPCRDGVSHRPDEFASIEAIQRGVQALAALLAEMAQ